MSCQGNIRVLSKMCAPLPLVHTSSMKSSVMYSQRPHPSPTHNSPHWQEQERHIPVMTASTTRLESNKSYILIVSDSVLHTSHRSLQSVGPKSLASGTFSSVSTRVTSTINRWFERWSSYLLEMTSTRNTNMGGSFCLRLRVGNDRRDLVHHFPTEQQREPLLTPAIHTHNCEEAIVPANIDATKEAARR